MAKNHIYIGILILLFISFISAIMDEPLTVKKPQQPTAAKPTPTPTPTPQEIEQAAAREKEKAAIAANLAKYEKLAEERTQQLEDLAPAREKVKALFISDEEPTAKYARWKNNNTFQVLVIDDGTKRDGYAESVCLTLYQHGFTGKNITAQVIGWHAMMQDKYEKRLGSHDCIET